MHTRIDLLEQLLATAFATLRQYAEEPENLSAAIVVRDIENELRAFGQRDPGAIEHTPGPIFTGQDGCEEMNNVANYLKDGNDRLIAYGQMSAADARRLAASWNACIGVPTEDLEASHRATGI